MQTVELITDTIETGAEHSQYIKDLPKRFLTTDSLTLLFLKRLSFLQQLVTVYAVVIAWAVSKVTGNYLTRELGGYVMKILAAGAAALLAWLGYRLLGIELLGGKLAFVVPLMLCGVVYIGVIWKSGLAKVLLPKRVEQE